LDDFLQFSASAPGDEQPDADGGVARRHGQNRGGGEGCGYAASLGQRERVAHIPTAEAEAARSDLILEGQGQARLHLKFNDPWSHEWGPVQFGYTLSAEGDDLTFDERDSAPFVPKSVVVDPNFDWRGEYHRRNVPWDHTIVYEAHVKGFTKLHPEVDEHLRGFCAGLGSKPVVDYIRSLGVTTIELMPVHTFIDDSHLLDKGLKNYWGYNSIGFF